MIAAILSPLIGLFLAYKTIRLGIALILASLFYAVYQKVFDYALKYAYRELGNVHIDGIFGYIFNQLDLLSALALYLSIVTTYVAVVSAVRMFERFYHGS